MILESKNVKDGMFIMKINGTELRFGIKEFAAITGLKCGLLIDFFSDPYIPNRIILKYFRDMTKTEDRLKIGILYFITSLLTSSEALKTTIPKLYFDLVESGQYVNFPWGNECFRLTLKACSHRLGKNPMSFKFSQFHIALQVWFYECCHPFDNTVVICVSNVTPRILNWKTSNESIFFDDLKNTIIRTHGNQHKFRNIVLTDEEHDVDFDEKYVELKKEIAEVDKYMTDMKAYVDNSTKLIIEEIKSSRGQPLQTIHQHNDAHQHVEES
ncbi:hypothetical protein H5410_043383 [Solanum commersonii]|uniref:DUF1985 domain-containing protein n=1 Tax=Solanum commersonii TaxID=4109 RepID=A0A9J5XYA3_SOLCO|nr:hypothetical protein H5410_043383 [Solanum commersonii]